MSQIKIQPYSTQTIKNAMLFSENLQTIIHLHALYIQNPANVDISLQHYFSQLESAIHNDASRDISYAPQSINSAPPHHSQQTISTQYQIEHITKSSELQWLRAKIQDIANNPTLSTELQRQNAELLIKATTFEEYLHKNFLGMKRFSIQGLESIIPALAHLINISASQEIVIGMAHRGRLNVLHNVLHKPAHIILQEAMNIHDPSEIHGDVKYHNGWTSSRQDKTITLLNNPSHLETISGAVIGTAKAAIDAGKSSLPIILHGDSAISGQGIVMEILAMSQLNGYTTNGTIHIVANNRIGFTTTPNEYKSSEYCTDIAKLIAAPVFHVDAYRADDIIHAINLANEYREKFHKDVFIDIIGYRLYGHNESDEPRFTQPKTYQQIDDVNFANIAKSYVKDTNLYAQIEKAFVQHLDVEIQIAKTQPPASPQIRHIAAPVRSVNTKADLISIGEKILALPQNFTIHPKILKLLNTRQDMLLEKMPCDWGMAEMLALGSILHSGMNIRFTGQDAKRGTFSHRHASLIEQNTEQEYVPLTNASSQSKFRIYNSPLSEYGALSFEYGYSCKAQNTLTIWEAQFGDFANGAQIVIDQLISAGYEKWKQHSNLVLLLPHGYEGQGPEHSSARLERFLQLCANDNMRVCNCTTPASFFQILTQQMTMQTPLIIMSPKSLLRHKDAKSDLSALLAPFAEILHEPSSSPFDNLQYSRIVFCSGKVFFDLLDYKNAHNITNTALIRLEQLYPFPADKIAAIVSANRNAKFIWCQEEPKNMGAFSFVEHYFRSILKQCDTNTEIYYSGRTASASPATGFADVHISQQNQLITEAMTM